MRESVHTVDDAASAVSQAQAPIVPTFEDIYDEHMDFVWRNLRRRGVPESSLRDATQDVFLVVHRRLSDFEGRSTIRSWLYGIVVRVASHYGRTGRRKNLVSAQEPDAVADARALSPERSMERAEAVRLVLSLLEELSEVKREVFVLAVLEQMTVPAIAAAIGENPSTVYSRLRVARMEFEQALGRRRAQAWRQP